MKKFPYEIIKLITFFIGIIGVGLGVALMNKSNLGLGPWNVTDANLERWIGVTIGQASIIHTFVIITIVAAFNRHLKYYLSLITTVLVGFAIDIWNYEIFRELIPSYIGEQILFEVLGFFGITIGLALIMMTKYPAMVFDELTLTLQRLFKQTSFALVRMVIEFTGLILALLYGLIGGFGLGAVGINPIILAFLFGPAIHFFKSYFERIKLWK